MKLGRSPHYNTANKEVDVTITEPSYGEEADETRYKDCILKQGHVRIARGEESPVSGYGVCVFRPDDIVRAYLPPTDGKFRHRARRRGELYAELWSRVDSLFSNGRGSVPVPIAVLGKPAIAAYLFAVDEMRPETISDQLEVSDETVWKYFRRVRTDGEGWD